MKDGRNNDKRKSISWQSSYLHDAPNLSSAWVLSVWHFPENKNIRELGWYWSKMA